MLVLRCSSIPVHAVLHTRICGVRLKLGSASRGLASIPWGLTMHCLEVIRAPGFYTSGRNVELDEFATLRALLQPGRVGIGVSRHPLDCHA